MVTLALNRDAEISDRNLLEQSLLDKDKVIASLRLQLLTLGDRANTNIVEKGLQQKLAAAEAVRRALEAQVEELLDQKRYSSAKEGRSSQTPVQSAPQDDVIEMRGRCAALTAELKRLQSECAAQSAEYGQRMLEMEENCHHKVADLRKAHEAIVQELQADFAVRLSKAEQDAGNRLRESAALLETKRQETEEAYEEKLRVRDSERGRLTEQLEGCTTAYRQLEERQMHLTDRVRELESLLAGASQQEVCDMMEGRLVKLSGLVRSKEDEIADLRQQLQNCRTEETALRAALTEALAGRSSQRRSLDSEPNRKEPARVGPSENESSVVSKSSRSLKYAGSDKRSAARKSQSKSQVLKPSLQTFGFQSIIPV